MKNVTETNFWVCFLVTWQMLFVCVFFGHLANEIHVPLSCMFCSLLTCRFLIVFSENASVQTRSSHFITSCSQSPILPWWPWQYSNIEFVIHLWKRLVLWWAFRHPSQQVKGIHAYSGRWLTAMEYMYQEGTTAAAFLCWLEQIVHLGVTSPSCSCVDGGGEWSSLKGLWRNEPGSWTVGERRVASLCWKKCFTLPGSGVVSGGCFKIYRHFTGLRWFCEKKPKPALKALTSCICPTSISESLREWHSCPGGRRTGNVSKHGYCHSEWCGISKRGSLIVLDALQARAFHGAPDLEGLYKFCVEDYKSESCFPSDVLSDNLLVCVAMNCCASYSTKPVRDRDVPECSGCFSPALWNGWSSTMTLFFHEQFVDSIVAIYYMPVSKRSIKYSWIKSLSNICQYCVCYVSVIDWSVDYSSCHIVSVSKKAKRLDVKEVGIANCSGYMSVLNRSVDYSSCYIVTCFKNAKRLMRLV